MMLHGIDISAWNGNIDILKYHPDFVIIRAGYGIRHKDDYLDRNIKECRRLGIPFGLYWFSEALTPDQADEEADFFLHLIRNLEIDCGVWFDMEDSTWKSNNGFVKTKESISDICYRWCDRVERAGYYTGIYCSESWLQYMDERLNRFDRWVANWSNGKEYGRKYGTMFQYTDRLGGNVLDGDVCYVPLSTYKIERTEDKYDKLVSELAERALDGEFGNGIDRVNALGPIYDDVQERINQIIGGGI
jgi:GH25 family lysozyme M1 (1,4-beta-N-acetylmuramidase)